MDKAKVDIESLAVSRILVVVAHPDDIESWCAGTVCRFVDAGKHDDWVGRCSGMGVTIVVISGFQFIVRKYS